MESDDRAVKTEKCKFKSRNYCILLYCKKKNENT